MPRFTFLKGNGIARSDEENSSLEAGDEHLAVGVGDVGNRLEPAILLLFARLGVGLRGGVGQLGAGETHLVERHELGLAVGLHAHEHRHGIGALAARHREIRAPRNRVHRQILDDDLGGLGAEEGGDFFVDGLGLNRG